MPAFLGAGSGVTVTGTVGTVSKTGCVAGNIICVHVVVNGTQNPSVGSVVNIEDLAGTNNATTPSTGAPFDIGSPQTGVQNMHWGRVMADGTCSVDLTITSNDFIARIYEFSNGSIENTYAEVMDNTASASEIRQSVGTSTTPAALSPAVVTSVPDRLALAFVGITGNVAVSSMTGETGGDWTEAIAAYADTPGTMQLQIAPLATVGTITGGTQTIGSSQGWAVDTIALAGPHSPYAKEVMADSPVAYYRMNETSGQPQDYSGNGNHTTTLNGTPDYSQPGAISDESFATSIRLIAASFEWFAAPDHATLDVGDVFTMEALIKRASTTSGEHAILSKGQDAGNVSGPEMTIAGNQLFLGKEDIFSLGQQSGYLLDLSGWHHVAVTKNGATIRFYIDGLDRTGWTNNTTIDNNTQVLGIGVIPDATGGDAGHFDGWLQEVAFYNTALSPARILAHYEAFQAVTSIGRRGMGTAS